MKAFILVTLLFVIAIADVSAWVILTYNGEINFTNGFFIFIGVILFIAYFNIINIKKMRVNI